MRQAAAEAEQRTREVVPDEAQIVPRLSSFARRLAAGFLEIPDQTCPWLRPPGGRPHGSIY